MSDNPYAAPESTLTTEDNDEDALLKAAIGPKNTSFYLRFLHGRNGPLWRSSWNWPAFFMTSVWLVYRKMWLMWLVYMIVFTVAVQILLVLLTLALGDFFGAIVGVVASLALSFVLVPMYANSAYEQKLQSLIDRSATVTRTPEERLAWLEKKGGTSLLVAIVVSIIPIMLVIGILAAIVLPAYQEYVEAAQRAAELSQ